MKLVLLTTTLLLSGLPTFAQQAPARKYFNELDALGAFNHYADKYVCFNDGDDQQGFAIISTFVDAKTALIRAGDKKGAELLSKAGDGLSVQTYYKGVATNEGLVFDWVTDNKYQLDYDAPIHHGRSVYLINWKTGRYRLQVFALDHSKTLPALEVFGKCELIHPNDTPSILAEKP